MKFGITLPNFDLCSDPRIAVQLAQIAEESGWDGIFLWDHVLWTWPHPMPVSDPFMLLATMSAATSRIKLGTMVTPVPRRRPWTLARQLSTLDHISGGRTIAGVGLGGDWFGDYSGFGEPTDQKAHGEMLDEGLDVITGLWSAEPFSYEGKHFQIKDAQFLPKPVQEPRIPVWVAGMWPNKKPFRRAAKWDGVYPIPADGDDPISAQDLRDILDYTLPFRNSDSSYDVIVSSVSNEEAREKERDHVAGLSEVGATWWLAGFNLPAEYNDVRKRLEAGPPR